MLVAEDSEVEVIGIRDIYPVVKAQESGGVLRPSRIGGVRQGELQGCLCEVVLCPLGLQCRLPEPVGLLP